MVKPPPKGPTYNWFWLAGDKYWCTKSRLDRQTVLKFAEAKTLSVFHDEDLAQCTKELNAAIKKFKDARKSEEEELSVIKTSKGLLLAWAGHAVSDEDDDEVIAEALGIKMG